ncbi:MAG TPA: hypothetical protein VGK38_13235 [Prolixibacteraceae bacterium]
MIKKTMSCGAIWYGQNLDYVENKLFSQGGVLEVWQTTLKNNGQIEHSRHRSLGNFLTNLISVLLANSYLPKKPSIKYDLEPPSG